MDTPLVSIIIPCYNSREELFRPCLSSAVSQTCTNIEILIVDDGSKPETAAFLEETALSDPRIRYIRKPNGGVSSARNFGMREAKGLYIAFLDDDDALPEYFVEEAFRVITEGNYDIVIGGTQMLRTPDEKRTALTGGKVTPCPADRMKLALSSFETRIEFSGAYVGRGAWARLIRREAALLFPFDETFAYGEDALWNQRFLSSGKRVAHVASIWYYYVRFNEQSATTRFAPDMHLRSAKLMRELRLWTDFGQDAFYRAYGYHLIEELLLLYRREISLMPAGEGRTVRRMLYTEEPWTFLKGKRLYRLAGKRHRAELLLYRLRLFFFAYGVYWWLHKLVDGKLGK